MIARKSALIIFIQLMNGILGYIGLKFISLYMHPWEYGVVGFAFGFVSLFTIFGTLGFNRAHVKRVSEGKNLSTCIGTYFTIKLLLTSLFGTAVIGSIAVWRFVFDQGFESTIHEQTIYIMLAYFVLLTLAQSMIFTFNAKKEIARSQLPLLTYNFVRICATVYVALNGLGPLSLAYTYLLGEIFHLGLALYLFRGYPIGKPSFLCFKDYSSFAIHVAPVVISALIITNIDKIFIQFFWSAQQVGEYFAVYNLSRYIILFSSSIGVLLLPTVSEHHAKKKFSKIKELVLKSERYISMIVFPIIIFMVVLASEIIPIILSGKYEAALPVLQILPFFVLLSVLSGPYHSYFQGMNLPKIARNRVLIMVIINIILNFLLVPSDIQSLGIKLAGLGAVGASLATVIAYMFGFVYIRFMAWKLNRIKGDKCIILHAFSAIISGLIISYISLCIPIVRWYQLVLITVFGFAIYISILYLLREFKKEDYDFFMDTLNLKHMYAYIRKEIRGK